MTKFGSCAAKNSAFDSGKRPLASAAGALVSTAATNAAEIEKEARFTGG
jgi:hypothetical protein